MYLLTVLFGLTTAGIYLADGACPTSKGCFPSAGNIAFGRNIHANSTCGNPARLFEINRGGTNLLDTCDTSNAAKSHPATLANDGNQTTFWAAEEYTFFVTLQLDFAFPMRLEKSTLIFRSYRPQRMILEKSSDGGVTWTPYQFYAGNCFFSVDGLFQGLTDVVDRNNLPDDSTEAFCFPVSPGSPEEFGQVEFRAAERFRNHRFDNEIIIDHLVVTNLRARFRELYTLGDDLAEPSPVTFRKYFYSVTEWVVEGHCYCNGHAETCIQRDGESTQLGKILSGCDCQHNTMGDHCEECLPFYNNRPYRKGNSTDPNECELCECHQHSQSCVYDSAKDHGVCQNCTDNTEGDMCERCIANFYHDPLKTLDDPRSCVECNCSIIGSSSMDCDSVGACSCKTNVQGSKCNVCKPGFFNLQASDPNGCQACTCNVAGTAPGGNSTCSANDGTCQCKTNVAGGLCDVCKAGYYNLDASNLDGCTPCGCSSSTAFSLECNRQTGQCSCRQGLTSRTCNETVSGQYSPYLEGIVYEAETTQLFGATAVFEALDVVPTFTGTGFARLSRAGDRVMWWVTVPPRTINYTAIIRYRASDIVEDVVVNMTGDPLSETYSCPGSSEVFSGTAVLYETMQLPAAALGGGTIKSGGCQRANRRIEIVITYQPVGVAIDWYIDSLVLVPNPVHVLPFTELQQGSTEQQETADCYVSRELVSSYSSSLSPPCPQHTFLANAWLFNGTLDCGCHGDGSMSTVCQPLGGDCPCRNNVIGRSCSACAYSHFNLTQSGCEACGCSPLGSVSSTCDITSGHCSCRPFTTGINCDFCIENYFNLSNCEDCGCHSDYSQSLQCDSQGVCQCDTGIAGEKCNEGCLPEFFGLTSNGCVSCVCDSVGRLGEVCDNATGQCPCRTGATGLSCDTCRDGYFDFSPLNKEACISCFCYNHSTQCTSAIGFSSMEIKDDFSDGSANGWRGVTSSGSVVAVVSTVVLDSNFQAIFVLQGLPFTSIAYFDAPFKFLGNKRLFYGQTLVFDLRLTSLSQGDTLMSMVDGDVVIKGQSLQTPIAAALPHLPTRDFQTFTIQLVETNFYWGNLNGRQVTVREMFDTLLNVEYLRIRSDFGQGTGINPQIDDVILGVGASQGITELTNVENCTCPEGHMGLSCEQCLPGYKRSIVGGTVYDSCVPCECNSHSSLCDVVTGDCLNCGDNTEGERCQRCVPGYYGDATKGTATDCQKCPCPLTDVANQFSPTCFLDNDGQATCDMCSDGHTGRRCEACDDGYFGQPEIPDSSCQVCTCSGNINVIDNGNCNTTTGECLKCVNNTAGFSCEVCAEDYFGNALTDSCQDCGCAVAGSVSSVCDQVTGECPCLPGVTGVKCDRCAPLHFGYDSGTGCSQCDCNMLGAENDTCDLVSGQCFCKNGVDSNDRRCGTCLGDFYDLSSTGCQACDCNTTNTRGGSRLCNNMTGQCRCLVGVIGRTCIACNPGFFGSPPDCLGCGECYNNWTRLIDELMSTIETEDSRISDLLLQHYGSLTSQQLDSNITALRRLLDRVSNFNTDTTSLRTAVSRLQTDLDAVVVDLGSSEQTRDIIIEILRITEERLNRTGVFNGTVLVETGVYRTSEQIQTEAVWLNGSAEASLSAAKMKLSDTELGNMTIQADKVRSDKAKQSVAWSLREIERTQNNTNAVNAVEAGFDSLYQNNSNQLEALRDERDSLNASLGLFLKRAQNATAQAATAKASASMAYQITRASETAANRDKTDVDQLVLDVTSLLTEAEGVYDNATAVKAEAERINSTAYQTLSDVISVSGSVDVTTATLNEANSTGVKVLGLSLPPLSQIENVSRQINESIVPAAEVNATIGQSRESRRQALDVVRIAEEAQNVSQQAADFVADIDRALDEASDARSEAQETIGNTDFIVTAVHTSLQKVQNDTSESIGTAQMATVLADTATDTLGRVDSCQTDSLAVLRNAETQGLENCGKTGPSVLQNATHTFANARSTLDANSSATEAAANLATVQQLRQQVVDIDEQARNTTQIELLRSLLGEYIQLRTTLEGQQATLNTMVTEMDDLLARIENQCNTGSC